MIRSDSSGEDIGETDSEANESDSDSEDEDDDFIDDDIDMFPPSPIPNSGGMFFKSFLYIYLSFISIQILVHLPHVTGLRLVLESFMRMVGPLAIAFGFPHYFVIYIISLPV